MFRASFKENWFTEQKTIGDFLKKRPQNDPKNTYNLCSIKEVDPEILE